MEYFEIGYRNEIENFESKHTKTYIGNSKDMV